MGTNNITPAQRAANFAQLTRQHIKALPAKSWTEGSTISFEIPRARLLSKIKLLIEADVTLTHSSTTTVGLKDNSPFPLVKKVEVNLNNGFSPYVVTGEELYFLNLLQNHGDMVVPLTDTNTNVAASRAKNKVGYTAASGGAANKLQMIIDLPLTLNDRDPAGLIMLQAADILVNVTVTMGTFITDLIASTSGFTSSIANAKITPIIETFSIPAVDAAIPDLTVMKLVHSRSETISAAGRKVITLPTGNMYRKLLVWIKDSSGGEADGDLSTDFEIMLNTADTPYTIPHRVLAEINQQAYGKILPAGLFVFDFTQNGGIPNFGTARDYIDTSALTQFELAFTAAAAGTVQYIYETLAILQK